MIPDALNGIGCTTGIGLRAAHLSEIVERRPSLGFLEVHTENYFGGGAKLKNLERLGGHYPLSFHCVGLSLGRADGLDPSHLRQVADLVRRFQPALVSEHLSWSAYAHSSTPDLLPLPFTHEALTIMAQHVDEFQQAIGRQILIENPSNYFAFDDLDFDEPEFLLRLCEMTGCGLLLDINNIYVSAHNLGHDPYVYLASLSETAPVKQYHLAGHETALCPDGATLLIDTHGQPVRPEVWALYEAALCRFGDQPTLIEWDTGIPELPVILNEAATANQYRAKVKETCHAP